MKGIQKMMVATFRSVLVICFFLIAFCGLIELTAWLKHIPMTGAAPLPKVADASVVDPLQNFIDLVKNGSRDMVVGVYKEDGFALPVTQQPQGDAGFVTHHSNEATQFALAGKYDTIGILAHNDLAGASFAQIQSESSLVVVYGGGHIQTYWVHDIQRYQALTPTSAFSDFIALDGTQERLTASQLFTRIYGPGRRLVLQTCIDNNGDPSWGRLFIIAEPAGTPPNAAGMLPTLFWLNISGLGLAVH